MNFTLFRDEISQIYRPTEVVEFRSLEILFWQQWFNPLICHQSHKFESLILKFERVWFELKNTKEVTSEPWKESLGYSIWVWFCILFFFYMQFSFRTWAAMALCKFLSLAMFAPLLFLPVLVLIFMQVC